MEPLFNAHNPKIEKYSAFEFEISNINHNLVVNRIAMLPSFVY